jgi:hypothetical protein
LVFVVVGYGVVYLSQLKVGMCADYFAGYWVDVFVFNSTLAFLVLVPFITGKPPQIFLSVSMEGSFILALCNAQIFL